MSCRRRGEPTQSWRRCGRGELLKSRHRCGRRESPLCPSTAVRGGEPFFTDGMNASAAAAAAAAAGLPLAPGCAAAVAVLLLALGCAGVLLSGVLAAGVSKKPARKTEYLHRPGYSDYPRLHCP